MPVTISGTTGLTANGSVFTDSSSNVGIGTSSPASRIHASYAGAVNTNTFNVSTISDTTTPRTLIGANLVLSNDGTTYTKPATSISGAGILFESINSLNDHGSIKFLSAPDSNSSSATPVERMRIDTSGNLLVGNSAQIWDERLSAKNSTSTVLAGFYAQSTSYTSSVIRAQAETTAGTGWYLFEGRAAGGGFQYGIRGNGTVATSDERRKKNIEPARSYLQDVCSIPVVKYNWKSDEDDAPKELGWLAQDVAKVFPNMVVTHHDGPNDDQEVLLLKKEVFLPMLMKCIQEQQALITALTARIEALEAK